MKRPFQELSVSVLGVQAAASRFPKRRWLSDPDFRPPIATWRCNLTALSQLHNLYFVASQEAIHVYEPQFPAQHLQQQPSLIVHCPPSRPGLRGSLDPRHPRSINYVVVQLLGNEEILAVARDDGDVDAFLVKHIVSAVERQAEPQSSIGSLSEIKPFFQRNVGESAWGLAIHSEARIIAVSANTHAVTIYKFGLVERGEETPDFEDRETDVSHSVLNGHTNIPYVAFCNTGDDPEGRWLLTTDVSGHCCCIDVRAMERSPRFSFGPNRSLYHEFDRVNAGWTIMFLDRRSFIREPTFEAALGLESNDPLPDQPTMHDMCDISSSIKHVPNRATKFSEARRIITSGNQRPPDATQTGSIAPPMDAEDDETILASNDEASQAATLPMAITSDNEDGEDDQDSFDDESDSGESQYMTGYEEDEPDNEIAPDLPTFSRSAGIMDIRERTGDGASPLGETPCPILHTSFRSVYLLQPPLGRSLLTQGLNSQPSSPTADSPVVPPTVTFRDVLRQMVPSHHHILNAFERLNMNAYVPSLGVLILASQKGRAIVLSLTKAKNSTRSPEKPRHSTHPTKTVYAMRIEHILPFADQETQGERPFVPLLGIATGPMQGTENLPDERKRWRLMMFYYDQSVLSYEISRSSRRDYSATFEAVVV